MRSLLPTKPCILSYLILNLTIIVAQAQPNPEYLRIYNRDGGSGFWDVSWTRTHQSPGFAACGYYRDGVDRWNHRKSAIWLLAADQEGQTILSSHFLDDNIVSFCATSYSIIGTDDGGYLIGSSVGYFDTTSGHSQSFFNMLKANERGDLTWSRNYGDNQSFNSCHAVIELKDGNFLGCGRATLDGNSGGYATVVNPDGEVIWQRVFQRITLSFAAVRETNGGFVFAGEGIGDTHGFILKTDSDGELLWSCNSPGRFWGLVSCQGGGFAVCGCIGRDDGSPAIWLVKYDNDGNEIWSQFYDLTEDSDAGYAMVELQDGGFLIVGEYSPLRGGSSFGEMVRTNRQGNLIWNRQDRRIGDFEISEYTSVVLDGDGSPVIAGKGSGLQPFLLGLPPVLPDLPSIITFNPQCLDTIVLTGDSIAFSVGAVDPSEDSLSYCWTVDGQPITEADSVTIRFPAVGSFQVKCLVNDGFFSDSVQWTVESRDLFIASASPDTLSFSLRRGTSQTFSLDTVRAVEGDAVEYQWTLTNIDNFEREETGTEASATVEFLRSGNYQMEGLAYRGESSDNVIWTIAVRSAILDFWPRVLNLSVLPDSLVNFGVLPFNPESDSLSYAWYLDGELIGQDSAVGWWFAPLDSQAGRSTYAVSAIVMDGTEGDTVRWEVTVQDPNATPPTPPSIEGREVPATFGIVSVSPNPFNSMTTIRYTTSGNAYPTRLTLHDLTGREVVRLVDERAQQSPPSRGGPYAVTFNGRELPAGMYLVRLQAGERQQVTKVVLVR